MTTTALENNTHTMRQCQQCTTIHVHTSYLSDTAQIYDGTIPEETPQDTHSIFLLALHSTIETDRRLLCLFLLLLQFMSSLYICETVSINPRLFISITALSGSPSRHR